MAARTRRGLGPCWLPGAEGHPTRRKWMPRAPVKRLSAPSVPRGAAGPRGPAAAPGRPAPTCGVVEELGHGARVVGRPLGFLGGLPRPPRSPRPGSGAKLPLMLDALDALRASLAPHYDI